MAMPLALVAAALGALLARQIVASRSAANPLLMVLLLPVLAGVERWPDAASGYEVASSIEDCFPGAPHYRTRGSE